jgi:hypothetical protein
METRFTVFFDDPFWVGVVERIDEQGYAVARVVFGGEPTEAELYDFVVRDYANLVFSAASAIVPPEEGAFNYKRRQREARRVMAETGVTSKAHEALRAELERHKQIKQAVTKADRDAEAERRYKLRQEQKKEKQRGR